MPTQVKSRRAVAVTLAQIRPMLGRAALSMGLAGLFVCLLSNRLADVDIRTVGQLLSEAEAGQWLAALLATAVSFWAVGHYDAVLHRHFGTRVGGPVARLAGVSAIAVSQTLGLGVITGAIVRWRMLPGVTLAVASKLTIAVALSFLAGWAVVTAVVLLVLPEAPFRIGAALVVAVATGGIVLAVAAPHRLRRHLPNLFTLTQLFVLVAVDTLAAAVALHVLMPAELMVPMTLLLPAFLLALGAGLVSGAPGGIGAFEVTLLALMPYADEPALLAAVLAWRLVYFAVPACLGALVAVKGPIAVPDPVVLRPRRAALAEAGIAGQGETTLLPGGGWLVGRTPHLTVGLFDPAADSGPARLALSRHARQHGTMPAIYKCGARMAVSARAAGWQVTLICREAWLDPRGFSLSAACRAGLRRKLRRAEAAGVTVNVAADLPLTEMSRIATQWAAAHGGERGFSMGRFAPAYVARQRIYLARQNGRLIAFATFHQGDGDWALDLMRHGPDLPDGTMQSLVAAAIFDAAQAGLPRLSLAAVPEAAFGKRRAVDHVLQAFGCDGAGLLQFKAGFAPKWRKLYLAAPGRAGVMLAAAEIARAVAHPPPLAREPQEYGFASASGPWHRRENHPD